MPKSALQKGFAVMRPEEVKRIASLGGQTMAKRKGWLAKIGAIGGRAKHRKAPALST